jgi:hypothetical protein
LKLNETLEVINSIEHIPADLEIEIHKLSELHHQRLEQLVSQTTFNITLQDCVNTCDIIADELNLESDQKGQIQVPNPLQEISQSFQDIAAPEFVKRNEESQRYKESLSTFIHSDQFQMICDVCSASDTPIAEAFRNLKKNLIPRILLPPEFKAQMDDEIMMKCPQK